MMFKAMSAGISPEMPDRVDSDSRPPALRLIFVRTKSLARAAVVGGLEQWRLGQSSIGAKWRQIRELATRSSLPE